MSFLSLRTFGHDDQLAFAKLSGDWNPMHVDAATARRLMYGAQVVHGVHLLLWALDCWAAAQTAPWRLSSIRSVFSRPVRLEQEVHCSLAREADQHVSLKLAVGAETVASVDFDWVLDDATPLLFPPDEQPPTDAPSDLDAASLSASAGSLPLLLPGDLSRALFPNLANRFDSVQLSVVLCTTRLVGMRCPGLNSIYSELELRVAGDFADAVLQHHVSRFDDRFGLIAMDVSAPEFEGTIKAFVRPRPRSQPSYAVLRKSVTAEEFGDQRAFVIGGSRGLGEVVAKLLAAGGANVWISYFRGEQDAQRVVDDIRSGGGEADSLYFDVTAQPEGLPGVFSNDALPTHIYYFATPHIAMGQRRGFSDSLFQVFVKYYVTALAATVGVFAPSGLRGVLVPSTVFVEDPPATMAEYAAAKSAAEIVCRHLERSSKRLTIHCPRLPRMETDQTASLVPVETDDPVPVMLRHIRVLSDQAS